MLFRILTTALAVTVSGSAFAQEPSGCDKFRWPIAREQALLKAAARSAPNPELPAIPDAALRLRLVPFDQVKLSTPPERAPRNPASFAGIVTIANVAKPGVYAVSMSDYAWIDAVQNGKYSKTLAFSGATDCESIRKVVKYRFDAGPLILQITGVSGDSISISITPSSE